MAWRFGGVRPGMTLQLTVERCAACSRRQTYDLVDIRPGRDGDSAGPVFACGACARRGTSTRLFLSLIHLIPLVHQDRARLGLTTAPFLVERQAPRRVRLPQDGLRLRLDVPECPRCARRREFFLVDVYDSGPLFTCPWCETMWHLHLDDLVTLLITTGHPDGVSAHWRALLPPVDRRDGELLGMLREEYARGNVWFEGAGTAGARMVVRPGTPLGGGYGHSDGRGSCGAGRQAMGPEPVG